MKLLLVSGGLHEIVSSYAPQKIEIINPSPTDLQNIRGYVQEVNPVFEGVLITDQAFTGHRERDLGELSYLLDWLTTHHRTSARMFVVTRDITLTAKLGSFQIGSSPIQVITCDDVRIPEVVYKHLFEQFLGNNPSSRSSASGQANNRVERPIAESGEKKSFFDRFKSKPKKEPGLEATDQLTRELDNISRGISRVAAITGHRGSGITSTVVNVAHEASKRGLSTIIIDMDLEYRSMNMYFSNYHELTKHDEEMNFSLIRTLARPQDYKTTAYPIKDNMWLAALGYRFNDTKLINQFYTSSKLVGLLSILRSKFNLIILDLPLDLLRTFNEALIHIDTFGLCVPNNLHAVLSTVRNVEVSLGQEEASYLNAKSQVIVTKYNDRSRIMDEVFTPDKVCEVLGSGISESFRYEMKSAGKVIYHHDFDSQIERDIPIVQTSTEFESAYGNILLRLMEGTK